MEAAIYMVRADGVRLEEEKLTGEKNALCKRRKKRYTQQQKSFSVFSRYPLRLFDLCVGRSYTCGHKHTAQVDQLVSSAWPIYPSRSFVGCDVVQSAYAPKKKCGTHVLIIIKINGQNTPGV